MTLLKCSAVTRQIWRWCALLVCFGLGSDLAQHPPPPKKSLHNVPGDDLAIAQLIDGGLVVIDLNGRAREFDLRPKNFFGVSRFSSDGKKIVGLRDAKIVVLNQNLVVEWEQPVQMPNVRSLALSPDGTKVVFAATDTQKQAISVCIVKSSGSEEILEAFSYRDDPDGSWVLSWDPEGRRVVFGVKGQIQILDLQTRTSRRIAAGFDPTWSPNGVWIAYRSVEGSLKLLDMASGNTTFLSADVVSMAHWSPDSKRVFVDKNYPGGGNRGCFDNSRFVVCRISDGACKTVYDPCGVRDWSFGWISGATQWMRAARFTEAELKKLRADGTNPAP